MPLGGYIQKLPEENMNTILILIFTLLALVLFSVWYNGHLLRELLLSKNISLEQVKEILKEDIVVVGGVIYIERAAEEIVRLIKKKTPR